jgi:lactate racemase
MTVFSPKCEAALAFPWGEHDRLRLRLPDAWPEPEAAWPDLADPVADYSEALNRALDAPLGADPLERLSGAGTRVAIVVDDPSRWTPVKQALPPILERLQAAGVHVADIAICVGVGRHHAVDEAAMRARVGETVASTYPCFSPPVDDRAQYTDLGTTPEGVPVRVFRPVAEAGLRVLLGSLLPHLQAGFGGGYKLIFPGTSHRSTLGALHRVGLSGDAGRLLGSDSEHNPMRVAIRSAAALLPGPCFSVSHVLGPPGQVLHLAAGHPEPVQDVLAAEAKRRFRTPEAAPAEVVVAGNHPWPGDPLQSFKVLLHHRAASRPGGLLVGFFWTDPAEIDRSFSLRSLRRIAATGVVGGLAIRGGVRLAELAASAVRSPSQFLLRWARELVVDRTVLVYAPALCERVGPRLGPVLLFSEQETLWEAAARALGGHAPPRVRLFPQGGLTYCPEADLAAPRARLRASPASAFGGER